MHRNSLTMLAAAALGVIFVSCKDTKTLQQNEQLKSQVAQLQEETASWGTKSRRLPRRGRIDSEKRRASGRKCRAGPSAHPRRRRTRKHNPQATKPLKIKHPQGQDLHS